MESESFREPIPGAVADYVSALVALREQVLANTIICAEIPAPTFGEAALVRFMRDRFTESGLQQVSEDEKGNASAVLPGTLGNKAGNILVAAHVDKIWDSTVNHTVTVSPSHLSGPGVADNSLGAGTVVSLPRILEFLGIRLRNNLVLLGATRSMGKGDLEGIRFFLDNTRMAVASAVCIEGVQLGRLSYSCLGMNRGEIEVRTVEADEWQPRRAGTAISEMNRIVQRILAIPIPSEPRTSIILGSISAGSGFNVPPTRALLRFEVRSEAPGMVASIREQIEEIIEEANAEQPVRATLRIVARRRPGSIGFSHPLVRATRSIMEDLQLQPAILPSTSALSVLLERDIPSLTLGVTHGEHKHDLDEQIEIEPIFRGLAQITGVLQYIDGAMNNGED